jgi:hypothetical protein
LRREVLQPTARNVAREALGAATGSEFGANLVDHWFDGGGEDYVLSESEMQLTVSIVDDLPESAFGGGGRGPGRRTVNFYNTDLREAYGTATGSFDNDGNLVAIEDVWDVNPQPIGTRGPEGLWGKVRGLAPEVVTRGLNFVKQLFHTTDFPVRGRVNEPEDER